MEQGLLCVQHQMAIRHACSALHGWKRPHRRCTNHEYIHHRQGYGW